jgi:lipopolysaccharide biosynthesis regulator YciM
MRFFTIIFAVLLLYVGTMSAEENRTSVDVQIAQMEKALEEDRVRLVAQLKAMIVQINAQEHSDAVGKYQKQSQQEANMTSITPQKECKIVDE